MRSEQDNSKLPEAWQMAEVVIPHSVEITRQPPRVPEEMQDNYLERFDHRMIFADVFVENGKLVAVGAPPLNLREQIVESAFFLNGEVIESPTIEDRALMVVYLFDVDAFPGDQFEMRGDLGEFALTLSATGTQDLSGKHVLVAVQKDNDLEWIAYWAMHHCRITGVNSVLIYDNGSTRYSADDVRSILRDCVGVDCIVVRTNCPHGPTGGPAGRWDSNYGQFVLYEHARRKFLHDAKSVTVCDIDELMAHDGQGTIIERLETYEDSAFDLPRVNVMHILRPEFEESDPRTHRNYGYVRADRPQGHGKYIAFMSRLNERAQFLIHGVRNIRMHKLPIDSYICGNFIGVQRTWRDSNVRTLPNLKSWDFEIELDELLIGSIEKLEAEWAAVSKRISDSDSN